MTLLKMTFVFSFVLLVANSTSIQAQDNSLRGTPGLIKQLSNDAVQKELDLTEKQIAVANEAADLLSRIRDGKAQHMAHESVTKALSESQLKRLKQIHWQRLGGSAILERGVAETLELSDEQRKKLAVAQELNRVENKKMLDFMSRARFRSREAMEEYKAKYRNAANERLLSVLTEKQEAKLTEMLGEEFEPS